MEIFGWLGMLVVSLQFLPQLFKVIKTKKAEDVSLMMILLLCIGAIFWIIHGVIVNDLSVFTTNAFLLMVGSFLLYFKLKYKNEAIK